MEVETADQVIDTERRISQSGIETTGIDDALCCYASKTETWVEAPDNRWEWYVKTGDSDEFENIVVSGDGDGCCAPVETQKVEIS